MALGVGVLACSAGAAAAASPASTDPGVPPGLTKCADVDAYCGGIVVPLDRTGVKKGKTDVRFEYYPRTDLSRPSQGTIVAIEGGPGFSTTDSRDFYLELFQPLMDRRALLLVDQRGTGLSDPLKCPEAQSYDGNWVPNAEACGVELGKRFDLYTSANAADDLKAVLDSLGIPKIDLYGDSYGSFLSQTFAVRYPHSVSTLVLDGTYPITGLDPWYLTTATRLRDNLQLVCARSAATCPTTPGGMIPLVRQVVDRLRATPVATTAPDADGDEIQVTLTPRRVLDALLNMDVIPGFDREAPAALEALLAGDPRPLARMVAEAEIDVTGAPGLPRLEKGLAAEVRSYSEGAYLAYACNDYPQLWDVNAPFATRDSQFAAATAALSSSAVAPWINTDWATSEYFTFDYCIHWPQPQVAQPPFPAGGHYPRLATLVMNGDLDLRTDVYQAREVAANFPGSTYVEVQNFGHVTALYDPDNCASAIVRRFVLTHSTGDTSCTKHISEHRVVNRFAEVAADAPQATVASSADHSGARDRRVATVAVEAVADVIDRWYTIPGTKGVGLYGGKFTIDTTDTNPFPTRVWTLDLHNVQWTQDVKVSGTGTVPRGPGTASVSLTINGPGKSDGTVTVTWATRAQNARAHVTGTIGGDAVDLTTPAPSFF
jgi:pimeloyl-ACP methyl ester carboxylesterase